MPLAKLTPRQREVFGLAVQGLGNKLIARRLNITEGTVKVHLVAIFHKLGVTKRSALAHAAGILPALP
jgi:DNA-binding NarL/FixJ family response regulator